MDYLSSRSDFDPQRVAYYGFSMGAAPAIPAVALEPRFKAVILLTGRVIRLRPSAGGGGVEFRAAAEGASAAARREIRFRFAGRDVTKATLRACWARRRNTSGT